MTTAFLTGEGGSLSYSIYAFETGGLEEQLTELPFQTQGAAIPSWILPLF